MNRRFFLRFLGLAPLAAPVAIIAARDAAAGAPAAGGVRALLANSKHPSAAVFWQEVADQLRHAPPLTLRPLTEAERAEFRRRYIDIDRVLRDEAELLESRRLTIDEICKFMGVPLAKAG